ncbi:hypothetical protein [Mangrovimonas sp. YM274]|uniref:hypothetical protein n=1 Tax=Mangrovimonas sp. YM274 TaxID=3070660 RepID=UPI0027DC55F7|nr:hypothetical protein [Mangrovimonas sp. YM274]WMI69164.1 hypothetical protein RBH95_02045 [Mangrovimonas sp. YM274]
MKRILNIVLIIFISGYTNFLMAQRSGEHLVPATSIFDYVDYNAGELQICNYLLKGMHDLPHVRFLKIPSRDPEEVIELNYNHTDEIWTLTYRTRGIIIHRLEEVDVDRFPMIEYTRELPKEIADKVFEVYALMINNTKYYKNPRTGKDGVSYYFSVFDKGLKGGKIWSPDPKSPVGRLIEISEDLVAYVKKEMTYVDELRSNIDALIMDLNKK